MPAWSKVHCICRTKSNKGSCSPGPPRSAHPPPRLCVWGRGGRSGGRKRDDDRVLVAASSPSHRGRWEPVLTSGLGQVYKSPTMDAVISESRWSVFKVIEQALAPVVPEWKLESVLKVIPRMQRLCLWFLNHWEEMAASVLARRQVWWNFDDFMKKTVNYIFIERWESDDKLQVHREYYRILDIEIHICINYCLRIRWSAGIIQHSST